MKKLLCRFFDRFEEPKKIIQLIGLIGSMLIYAGFIGIYLNNGIFMMVLWILGIVFMWLEASFEVAYDTYLNES